MPVEYRRDVPAALPMSRSTQTGSRKLAMEPLEPKRRSVFLSTRSLRFFRSQRSTRVRFWRVIICRARRAYSLMRTGFASSTRRRPDPNR